MAALLACYEQHRYHFESAVDQRPLSAQECLLSIHQIRNRAPVRTEYGEIALVSRGELLCETMPVAPTYVRAAGRVLR
jgi:hypothetical protein